MNAIPRRTYVRNVGIIKNVLFTGKTITDRVYVSLGVAVAFACH